MKVIKNELSQVPHIKMDIDDLKELPFIPKEPLPKKSFAMYLVGSPASGKSNLLMALMSSHPTKSKPNKPLYYFKYFDRIELISGSLQTLPKKILSLLPDEQLHDHFNDELLQKLLEDMKQGENSNNLIILDDSVKDIVRSKTLSKCFLNRRHCTYNPENEGQGGLSIITASQKYNLLPLEIRCNQSHVILFKSSNKAEIECVTNELMSDLNKDEIKSLLEMAWREKYSFLMIDVNKPKEEKYYIKFDKVEFD